MRVFAFGIFAAALSWGCGQQAKDQPLTKEGKAYVHNLQLIDVGMKATESYAKQTLTEIEGNVKNAGDRTVDRVEKHVEKIGATSGAILDTAKQQLAKVDELLTDASKRAKVQMDRAEMVLDDSMTRVQQTVSYVQSGVVRPVREVYGVLAGIRTTLSHLGRGGRPTVDHATSDEEMFI